MLAIRYAVLVNSIMLNYFHFSAGDFPYCSHSDPKPVPRAGESVSLSKQHSDMPSTVLAQVSIIPSLYIHWQGAGAHGWLQE